MFVGLAPFFAIMDRTVVSENFWEHCEIILLGLAVLFFTAFLFDISSMVMVLVLVLAITYTLPFLGFTYVYKNLGPRSGKSIIIILWLGIEYTLIKIQWPSQTIFFGRCLSSNPSLVEVEYQNRIFRGLALGAAGQLDILCRNSTRWDKMVFISHGHGCCGRPD